MLFHDMKVVQMKGICARGFYVKQWSREGTGRPQAGHRPAEGRVEALRASRVCAEAQPLDMAASQGRQQTPSEEHA